MSLRRKIPPLWHLAKTKTGANWLLKTRPNLYKTPEEQNHSCSRDLGLGHDAVRAELCPAAVRASKEPHRDLC